MAACAKTGGTALQERSATTNNPAILCFTWLFGFSVSFSKRKYGLLSFAYQGAIFAESEKAKRAEPQLVEFEG
jgi:hypothetical protein